MNKKLRLLLLFSIGMIVFKFNGHSNLHPYLQIYITLLEAQLGGALILLLTKHLAQTDRNYEI